MICTCFVYSVVIWKAKHFSVVSIQEHCFFLMFWSDPPYQISICPPNQQHYMQEGPRFEKYPNAIQFLGTYVIVMGVSNLPGNLAYGPLDVAYITWPIQCHDLCKSVGSLGRTHVYGLVHQYMFEWEIFKIWSIHACDMWNQYCMWLKCFTWQSA